MSKAACKEVLCIVAEAAYAASGYSEFATDEELRECAETMRTLTELRLDLAKRADRADE